MGQKIHPIGFRIGINRGWDSHWFYDKRYYSLAVNLDHNIRTFIKKSLGKGIISHIEVERAVHRIKVTIFTSRPGAVIGRGGKGIDDLSEKLNKTIQKLESGAVAQVNVTEVRQPDLDAQLVAENTAMQLERRIPHRRAMRQAMNRSMRMGARGIKVEIAGKLGNSEIARKEKEQMGQMPRHKIRADIDYAVVTAFTLKGSIGVKVWIYKGEILPDKQRQRSGEFPVAESSPRPRRDRPDRNDRNTGDDRRDRGNRYLRRDTQPAQQSIKEPEVTQNVNA